MARGSRRKKSARREKEKKIDGCRRESWRSELSNPTVPPFPVQRRKGTTGWACFPKVCWRRDEVRAAKMEAGI